MKAENTGNPLREKLYLIIFEADTPAGKAFDVALLWAIMISVAIVFMESINSVREVYGTEMLIMEWFFTGLFTIEYFLRIYCVRKRMRYIFSFYGIIDLFSIVPTYIAVLLPPAQPLIIIRIIRVMRVFRILKLTHFVQEAEVLKKALVASMNKISIFLFTVITILVVVASLIYVIEGPENGFNSIPTSLYWAIVTITTVGYGDFVPVTTAGRFLANFIMILGYALIAVPTGIVSLELAQTSKKLFKTCRSCNNGKLDMEDAYCRHCGKKLD